MVRGAGPPGGGRQRKERRLLKRRLHEGGARSAKLLANRVALEEEHGVGVFRGRLGDGGPGSLTPRRLDSGVSQL